MTLRRLAFIAGWSAVFVGLAAIVIAPQVMRRADPCTPLPSMFATHGQCVVVQEFYARRAG